MSAELCVRADELNLSVYYERRGITVVSLVLRREAAAAAVARVDAMIDELDASSAGDPERMAFIAEFIEMVREVLGGESPQTMSFTDDEYSTLNDLFGAVS